jgi:hypothetical protein
MIKDIFQVWSKEINHPQFGGLERNPGVSLMLWIEDLSCSLL